jgi:hypothetical protein
MYSFKMTDFRNVTTSVTDCVEIVSDGVLGVAQCLVTASGVDGVRACSLV